MDVEYCDCKDWRDFTAFSAEGWLSHTACGKPVACSMSYLDVDEDHTLDPAANLAARHPATGACGLYAICERHFHVAQDLEYWNG